jgi:S1-C subfamily serine protease
MPLLRRVLLLALALVSPLRAQGAPSGADVRDLIDAARHGVLRIEAGLNIGTGFLVDTAGYVVTNDHVIGNAAVDATVWVNDSTRVLARVLARDRWLDLAVLRVAPAACGACRPLRWTAAPEVRQADPVVVLGYPFEQPLSVTTGIVSALRTGALLTDANINPGNSGGPVLTRDTTVVAVATFGIGGRATGPGLGGAVLLMRLPELLAQARQSTEGVPPASPLPIVPKGRIPLAALRVLADSADLNQYEDLGDFTTGPFRISVVTPLSVLVHDTRGRATPDAERRKREAKADVPVEERYSYAHEVREWMSYVGLETAPVIVVRVEPRIVETYWSGVRRTALHQIAGDGGAATLKFQGDVRGLTLKRNGTVVESLRGGHAPITIDAQDLTLTMRDVADFGYYVFAPEVFRPDGPQRPPVIEIEVADLKAQGKVRRLTLPPAMVARAWNDADAQSRLVDGPRGERIVIEPKCVVSEGSAAMQSGAASTAAGALCEWVVPPPRS